jgi:hypothetical protein
MTRYYRSSICSGDISDECWSKPIYSYSTVFIKYIGYKAFLVERFFALGEELELSSAPEINEIAG